MKDYILAIDQGTSSSRAIIFDSEGKPTEIAQEEFSQHFPKDGWVEHEPEDIWQTVLRTVKRVLKKTDFSTSKIRTIGITNQRETTLIWDRETGTPVYRAIVWQDRRTSTYCKELADAGYEEKISNKTGLLLDPYFSATKIKWILDSVPGAREKANRGELAFGTVDTYLLWKLTGGKEHKTEATNASRTMIFNIHTQQWDQELLELFDIPASLLPEVKDSSDDFGTTEERLFGTVIPINGMAGDQQAALFGQTCFEKGMAKSTYGTGCFMMVNTGNVALKSSHRLLTTIAYRLNGKPTYALEGSIFIAGATIQWLRDGLKIIANASDAESLAEKTSLEHGV